MCQRDGKTEKRVWEGPAGAQAGSRGQRAGEMDGAGSQSVSLADSQQKDRDSESETQMLTEGGRESVELHASRLGAPPLCITLLPIWKYRSL